MGNGGVLFGRLATLVIAPTSGRPGVDVTGLRIQFEVRKTSSSSANAAKITVWNLAKETRNLITEKNTAVILRAGYGETSDDTLPLLASGVVRRAEHEHQGQDVTSVIEIRDGGIGLDETEYREAFPRGTSWAAIARSILERMPDVSIGALSAEGLSGVTPARWVASGRARGALDKLARARGFEWSVQNGVAQLVDRTSGARPQILAELLSSETGMIGSPTKTNVGCKVKSLLRAGILPGDFINVRSDFYTGYLKALVVEHKGDTDASGEFTTEIEAKDLMRAATAQVKKLKT